MPSKAVFIIFPKLETCYNTHHQNAYTNAFRNELIELLRLSLNSIASTSRNCIAQFHPWSRDRVGRRPLRRPVGDIKAFQNDFAFIISTETGFWLKRVQITLFWAFQKGVSNHLIKTALRLSAKITLKVWKL